MKGVAITFLVGQGGLNSQDNYTHKNRSFVLSVHLKVNNEN